MNEKLLTAGLVLTWIMTPESLVLAGKISGISGSMSAAVLAGAVVLCLIINFVIRPPAHVGSGGFSDHEVLQSAFGKIISLAMIVCGRLPILFFASTAMLVSAGFAFNEIYVYWFPNFLFASILLFIITVVNIFGERTALKLQSVLVFISAAGLAIILLMAAGAEPAVLEIEAGQGVAPRITPLLQGISLALLCCLGFDFSRSGESNLVVSLSLLFGGVVLVFWAQQLSHYVDTRHLLESGISYILLAREAGGDVGRHIMGVAVISGASAGVNGLMIISRRSLVRASAERGKTRKKRGGWLLLVVFGVVIEIMMLTGFAGEEILDSQVRAALLLWLLYLGCRTAAVGLLPGKTGMIRKILAFSFGLSIWAVMAYLVSMDPMRVYIIKFMITVVGGAILASFIWLRLRYVFGNYKKVDLKEELL